MNCIFEGAPVISAYSRVQAIADDVLINVTETAKEAGFIYPVAVTAELWGDIEDIPPSKQGFEDVAHPAGHRRRHPSQRRARMTVSSAVGWT